MKTTNMVSIFRRNLTLGFQRWQIDIIYDEGKVLFVSILSTLKRSYHTSKAIKTTCQWNFLQMYCYSSICCAVIVIQVKGYIYWCLGYLFSLIMSKYNGSAFVKQPVLFIPVPFIRMTASHVVNIGFVYNMHVLSTYYILLGNFMVHISCEARILFG